MDDRDVVRVTGELVDPVAYLAHLRTSLLEVVLALPSLCVVPDFVPDKHPRHLQSPRRKRALVSKHMRLSS
jgi:hypothetical protein